MRGGGGGRGAGSLLTWNSYLVITCPVTGSVSSLYRVISRLKPDSFVMKIRIGIDFPACNLQYKQTEEKIFLHFFKIRQTRSWASTMSGTLFKLTQPRYHGQRDVSMPLISLTPWRDVLRNNAHWLPKMTTLRASLFKTLNACRMLSTCMWKCKYFNAIPFQMVAQNCLQ